MTFARAAHVAVFSLIIIGCIAEIVTSGILVGNFNNLKDAELFTSIVTRTKYLLFCGLWTILFSTIYVVGLATAPGHLLFSVASHLIWLGVTIVLFVSGSAALQTEINAHIFPHQQRLEILQGFAWADSILLGVAMLIVLVIGIGRRNGLSGNLLGEP
ncbi:hypothetical protein PGT21_032364 [Puccinia graminis f. sp. tritici]|uniref:MARVEL domain-containing protein n=2 Tax=Puccinia graminis f. sp. tritici TaxID=56615 RepID=H6QR51_PUCGT|nr:uncharacterized protein PGTG_21318 [Puccinia graminis f. sp. tritici CRL 75-36-700-3]EHS63026.1 hypothetical protein PGTG_21318 [Puccinia graminis f. sp. tritici CRL 75-36-700-3]KAA1109056.1 hypothetical protein PGT21_032364 [Puccinia graminis f. sp. tritici]